MNIIDERIEDKTVYFVDLNLGDFFTGLNTGNLYMKTNYNGDSPNAFNFTMQCTTTFTSFVSVCPVDVDVIIKRDK